MANVVLSPAHVLRRLLIVGLLIVGLLGVSGCDRFGQKISEALKLKELPESQVDLTTARKDFETKLRQRIAAPQVGDTKLAAPDNTAKRVTYHSGDLELVAWVSSPPQDVVPRPAVVYLHGGYSLGKGDWDDTQAFRNAGFVVMTPSLRGENGNPGNFEMFYGEVDDANAAGEYVAQLPYVDPERVYVAGHSIGGQLAVLSAQMKSPYRAAAAFSPSAIAITEWVTAIVESKDEDTRRQLVFDPLNAEEMLLRNPESFAAHLQIPLLMFKETQGYHPWFDFVYRAKSAKLAILEREIPGDHFTMLAPSVEETVSWFKLLNLLKTDELTRYHVDRTWQLRERHDAFRLASERGGHGLPLVQFKTRIKVASFPKIIPDMNLAEVEELLGVAPGHYGEMPRGQGLEGFAATHSGTVTQKTWSTLNEYVKVDFDKAGRVKKTRMMHGTQLKDQLDALKIGMEEAEVDAILSDRTKGLPPNVRIGTTRVWSLGDATITMDFDLNEMSAGSRRYSGNNDVLQEKYKLITGGMSAKEVQAVLDEVPGIKATRGHRSIQHAGADSALAKIDLGFVDERPTGDWRTFQRCRPRRRNAICTTSPKQMMAERGQEQRQRR